jgi:hypothetical protein
MTVSSGLLVALMFVGLLSIGIANILVALATLVNQRRRVKLYWVYLGWIVLLLLVFFDLFWQTAILLGVEQWDFIGFLYIISGPLLLFFATQVILPDGEDQTLDLRTKYFEAAPLFFTLLIAESLWLIGADVVVGGDNSGWRIVDVVAMALALVLAVSRRPAVHAWGVVIGWLVFLAAGGINAITAG